MAIAGMSGPPAMDIGMYSIAVGWASASVQTGVFETTPTMLSQGGAPSSAEPLAPAELPSPSGRGVDPGGALDRTRSPNGSRLGKQISANASLTRAAGSPRPP